MWAQQERFVHDMHAFVHEARELGYDAIEVSHATPELPFKRLLEHEGVSISSIHAPAPLVRDATDRANSKLNLAALDDEERLEAIRYTRASIDWAAQVGARYVVVHLGAIGTDMFDEERELRRLYDSGSREGERAEELREACVRLRSERIDPWLEMARDSLAKLAEYAGHSSIAIGIENRLHHHEIPLPAEARWLIDDYAPDAVGYWHDVGHAEVQWRLGLFEKRAWLDTNGARCIGAHLHDVTGLADHRAPGNGDVDWSYIRDGIPPQALRVFEINQMQPERDVARAIPFLRERGVIA
jgi:sugar phosphate isomerase/epimerase